MKYLFLAILASIGFVSFSQQFSTTTENVQLTENSCDSWLFMQSRGSFFEFGDLDIPGNKITVEAMINRTSPYSGGSLYAGDIVSKHEGPSNANYLLRPNHAEITTTNGYFRTPEICEFELNKTYHIAFVYDGSSLKFYRNGFLMSQVAASGNLIQNNYKSVIGYYDPQIHNTQFLGYINNVRIWNVARTQEEIRNLMNKPVPNPENIPGLRAYFEFSSLVNLQGNTAFNGRLVGSAQINSINPVCAEFRADSCCIESSGFLTGGNICEGILPVLNFSGFNGDGPYTIVYSDGLKNFTQTNVFSGVPFSVKEMPSQLRTSYTLISIQHDDNCPPTLVLNPEPAIVTKTNCLPCNGNLSDQLYNITFGIGNNPSEKLEEILMNASTGFDFVAVNGNPARPSPLPGQYTITNNIPDHPLWFKGKGDFSGEPEGRMVVFNLGEYPRELMQFDVQLPCGNSKYEFSAVVANIVDPAKKSGSHPEIMIVIENSDGHIIAVHTIDPMRQTEELSWEKMSFYFDMEDGQENISVKVFDISGIKSENTYAIALDEISIQQCSPTIIASFHQTEVKEQHSICFGTGVNLFGRSEEELSPQSIQWEYSIDNIAWTSLYNTENNIEFRPTESTISMYYFRIRYSLTSNTCVAYSNVISVSVLSQPEVHIDTDTVCSGSPAILTLSRSSGLAPLQIMYTDNTETHNFELNGDRGEIHIDQSKLRNSLEVIIVRIKDANGCSSEAANPVTIHVRELPQGGITGEKFCVGEPSFLRFETSLRTSAYSLTVSDGSKIYKFEDVLDGQKLPFPELKTPGEFNLSMIELVDNSTLACTRSESFDKSSATIEVFPNPVLQFDPLTQKCSLDEPFIISNAKEVSGLTGLWKYSGKGITASGNFQPFVAGSGVHSITYTYQADNGCMDSIAQMITIVPSPIAYAGPDRLICQDTVHLTAKGGTTYEWMPAINLSDPNIANPIATLYGNAEFAVRVGDQYGCFSYDTVKISRPSNNLSYFKLPSAFTPNGDGKNDCFGIQHWGTIELKEFSVYNRWGQKIFSTKNSSACWDGYHLGKKQETGGYVYIIHANTPCGEITRKGVIMLLQ